MGVVSQIKIWTTPQAPYPTEHLFRCVLRYFSQVKTFPYSVPTSLTRTGSTPNAGRIFSVKSAVLMRMELVFSHG